MIKPIHLLRGLPAIVVTLLVLPADPAHAQLMKVQCPGAPGMSPYTNLHPDPTAPATVKAITAAGPGATYASVYPGAIKCQEISGGDGYATMADGTQTYLFGFGPLSGIQNIMNGLPGTLPAAEFLNTYNLKNAPGASATNGAVLPDDPLYNSAKAASANGAAMEPAEMVGLGVLAAQQPAPLMAIDEDDEFYLTLSNVGMIMRPDLFEQHTVHFHGYPNASSYFDGVPDASVAVNISGSMTYYYTAPDAGTYFWHCHITPPEHLQMGMVGQLYVRPRQNQLPSGADLRAALAAKNAVVAGQETNAISAPIAQPGGCTDILCTGQTPVPPVPATTVLREATTVKYAYNDGDGSTAYDVEYPIQMMGFDPVFHFVGMTFNPEDFSGMKDKYFLLSGRSYPDTVNPLPITTQASDGVARPTQVIPTNITIQSCSSAIAGDCTGKSHRALLRISDLSVTEYSTLATIGIPMNVIAVNARLLRDQAGFNLAYKTNSITMGGGESTDVILDGRDVPKGTYFLYSTNLDHLSNDSENFGGMMTEIVVN